MVKPFLLLFTHENSGSLCLFCSRNTTYWSSKDALQHFVIWFFCLSSLLSTVDGLVEMLSLCECYYHCQQWRDLNIHCRKCSFLHMQRWLVLAKLKYILVYLTGSCIDSLERFLTSTRHIIFDSFIEFLSVKSSILFTAFTLVWKSRILVSLISLGSKVF